MSTEEIVPLVKQQIPTIVGFDVVSASYKIGEEVKQSSLMGRGQSSVYNFKPIFGKGDKEFEKKEYWLYYPLEEKSGPGTIAHTELLSAKESALIFLRTLFKETHLPEKVIVGEPAVRQENWRENFRRHLREVFTELGITHISFFPEPFAVFQYYRHIENLFPVSKQSETILIIDIGGGTFNSCIIRTTEQGLLARGGTTSIPLGLQGCEYGGSYIDRELLKIIHQKSIKQGLQWKEDPFARLKQKKSPVLLRVEEAKIKLSEAISQIKVRGLADNYSKITTPIYIPKDEFHPETDFHETLTGEDLKSVIIDVWQRSYGPVIIDTVNEAKEKLAANRSSLKRIDRVLVAGGSSQLPFMKEEISRVLSTLVDQKNIYKGSDIGVAVAYGIACECREQSKRDPKLSVGTIAPCIINDLYLGFREGRRKPFRIPKIKFNGTVMKNGQLLSAPFETGTSNLIYEIELPFNVPNKLYYAFTDYPIVEEVDIEFLNTTDQVFSIPELNKVSRKITLELEIDQRGFVRPTFKFCGKGDAINKNGGSVKCPEFYFAGFQAKEGEGYVGFDFGTSNSYLVRFSSIPAEVTPSQYPEFTISKKVKDKLREIEIRITELREKGNFTKDRLSYHAINQALDIIFHSNKIEGNPLTIGETEEVLANPNQSNLSEKQLEAKNLETAYNWMLENFESFFDRPEPFIREINKIINKDIKESGGKYRTESVSISGTEFKPPQSSFVPMFMEQLGEEIKTRGNDRSPLEFATSIHTTFVSIHPFIDGNGRTARLLLNAALLLVGLPVIVVNYADRGRYLDCLKKSNDGDLSALVEFFIECFEPQLEEFLAFSGSKQTIIEEKEDATTAILPPPPISETDLIEQAIQEISQPETTQPPIQESVDIDGPLAAVMKEKMLERKQIKRAVYEAWIQSFKTISAELKTIVESFNNHPHFQEEFRIKLQEYDLLPFEKYQDICAGKRATKTWFVSLEISDPTSCEKVLLFFNRASRSIERDPQASKVSLAVSRFDGTRYQRLYNEPIKLREIGYRNGELLFLSRDQVMSFSGVRYALEAFLADIIKSYM
jgi:molecular chaperone DnaK (HSP70)/fido (protein-threonine AMPylation protein)